MKLVELNWNPTTRQLRQFGGICLVALPFVGWVWGAQSATLATLAIIGFVVALASLLIPGAVKPLFIGLSLVAIPIGMVIGEVAILLIFLGVFLPIGLVFRFLHRDALRLRAQENAASHWQTKERPTSVGSYYRQF